MSKHLEAESVQPNPNGEDPETASIQHHDSVLQRIGVKAAVLMIGALVVEIAVIAFIAYLWFGTNDSETWHDIVFNNWTTRSVTLTALALRLSMAVQGATCLSMLAAITLEQIPVPVANVADISLVRAGNKTDFLSILISYFWPILHKGKSPRKTRHRAFVLAFVFMVLATTTLSQFASTALVSDLAQQFIPSANSTAKIAVLYDYEFTNASASDYLLGNSPSLLGGNSKYRYGYFYNELSASSYWTAKTPQFWPTFAESSEAPFKAKGVDDTGPNLRAFLPFASGQDRASIRNYTGKALVYDSRVTCQKPKIEDLTWDMSGQDFVGTGGDASAANSVLGILAGNFSSTIMTPRLAKAIIKAPFQCIVNIGQKTFNFNNTYWTVCELIDGYQNYNPTSSLDTSVNQGTWRGLTSQFRAQSLNYTGSSYLLIAPSYEPKGYERRPKLPTGEDTPFVNVRVKNPGFDILKGSARGRPVDESVEEYVMTLCLASQDVADRYVEAYSDSNRTEPTAQYDASTATFQFDNVIRQLVTANFTPEQRGVMRLKSKSDWTITSPDQLVIDGPDQIPYVAGGVHEFSFQGVSGQWVMTPYLLQALRIQGGLSATTSFTTPGSWSAIMARLNLLSITDGGLPSGINATGYSATSPYNAVSPEDWMQNLFSSLVIDKPAAALQALLTSVAGAVYYERLAQYDKVANTSQVYYVVRESPGGPYGQRRQGVPKGFLAVVLILILHLILVIVVTMRFIVLSKLARIGDGWQVIAHIGLSGESRQILEAAGTTRTHGGGRKAVKDVVESEGIKSSLVELSPDEHGVVRFRKV